MVYISLNVDDKFQLEILEDMKFFYVSCIFLLLLKFTDCSSVERFSEDLSEDSSKNTARGNILGNAFDMVSNIPSSIKTMKDSVVTNLQNITGFINTQADNLNSALQCLSTGMSPKAQDAVKNFIQQAKDTSSLQNDAWAFTFLKSKLGEERARCILTANLLEVVNLGGRIYYYSDCYKTWQDAQGFCRRYGMDLVNLQNVTYYRPLVENQLASVIIANNEPVETDGTLYWIGMQNFVNPSVYVWSNDTSVVTNFDWLQDGLTPTGGTQRCVGLIYKPSVSNNLAWDDRDCETKKRFICELQNPCADLYF